MMSSAPCGLHGCNNRPAPFPGRMSYKVTEPGCGCPHCLPRFLSVFSAGHFFCCVSLRLYVFCPLVVLVNWSVLAKSLARKTPLRKPVRHKEIISTKPRPMSAYHFGLVCCFIALLCVCVVPGPT